MTSYKRSRLAMSFTAVALLLVLIASGIAWLPAAFGAAGITASVDPSVVRWGFVAAAIATGMSSLAAGYAVGMVGSAGMGTLAEKPELLGRVLVLVGLAEGIAIYGLIISILILNKLG
jgi:V/A-type H+/Na+-transporting ATPase subunit K